jgi:uncharacterized repeat protein (TIGR01451 family)
MLVIRLCLLSFLLALMPVTPVLALNFVVDDAGSDPDDDAPADDNVCETAAGTCTLHAAIDEANERTGPHTITFDPSIMAIDLAVDLPDIRAEVTIDGTNAGAPGGRVDINGGAVMGVGGFDCFDFIDTGTVHVDDPGDPDDYPIDNADGGQGSTLSNLVIRNCFNDAIVATGHGYSILNNRIGTTPDGMTAAQNSGDGIRISGTIPPPAIPPNIGGVLNDPASNFGEIAAFALSLQGVLTLVVEPNFITGNLISGNDESGIELNNGMTTNTYVAGNIIGLSADSLTALPNGSGSLPAIDINAGAYGNLIGPGNIISGNTNDGIALSGAVILPNFIMGNLIGVGGAPALELGNGDHGININTTIDDDGNAPDNPTGYTAFIGPANIISDNKSNNGGGALDVYGTDDSGGISVDGEGVRIYGNAIGLFAFPAGLDIFGIGAQNPLIDVGNSGNGIVLNTGGHQVGGSEAFEANFILHNERHGILVKGSGTYGNVIQGNFIGVSPPTGLTVFDIGNRGNGIVIHSASTTQIGGTGEFEDNVIAGNGINGIALRQGATSNGWANLIQRNQIYANARTNANAGIGIDLEHDIDVSDVQPDPAGDDPNDSPGYANYGQNQPVICTGAGTPLPACATGPSYDPVSGNTAMTWTIDTRPNTTLRIEHFSLAADGMTFLNEETIMTDANGLPMGGSCVAGLCSSTVAPLGAGDTRGNSVVMTATDLFVTDVPPLGEMPAIPDSAANNTSEFSNAALVPDPGEVRFAVTSLNQSNNEDAVTLQLAAERLNGSDGPVSVTVTSSDGTANVGADYSAVNTVLSWNDGETGLRQFDLTIAEDLIDEPNETIMLALGTPTGGVEIVAVSSTDFTILDDDATPTVTINNVTLDEGNAATTAFVFSVQLSNPSSTDVTVNFATADDSATILDNDYATQSASVMFPAGSNMAVAISVLVNGDTDFEANETFFVNLTGVTPNATIADNQGLGTINNDDAAPDLSIGKTHVGDFAQGQTGAAYTITVSNSAAAATDGSMVTVTDMLPVGLTATGLSGTGWNCVLALLSCTRTDVLLQNMSYPAITLVVDVAADAPAMVTNTATVMGGGDITAANNQANDSTTITPTAVAADLSLMKSHVGNFTQGQTGATYTLTVSNSAAGATDGTMVSVVDTLPAGLTATAIAGTGWSCTLATLTCTRTDVLPVSSSYPVITVTVDVAANATSPQLNMATVSGGGDVTAANNTAMDSTIIDPAAAVADLSIAKMHVGNFTQGQTGATYTITVSNSAAAPTDGTMVSVVDMLPAGLTATNIAGTGWACTLATLTCTRTDVLPVSTSYPVITLTVDVAGNAVTPQVNSATVSGGGDTTPLNNTVNDSTTIDGAPAAPDLSLVKSHVGDFTQGQTGATYTLTVNNSAAAATDGTMVSVVDVLPAGLTATNIAGTGWTCTLATLTCTRSDVLPVSTSYPAITLTVDVAANAATPLINNATVTGGGDASPGNNMAADSTTITPTAVAADLSLAKSHVGNFTQGQTGATYTLMVSNSAAGATDGTMVSVVDTLPAGLTATNIAGTGWACTLATLTCTRTDVLPVSSSYPAITVTVDVAANATSPQLNMATVTGGGDVTAANNTAMDSTIIDPAAVAADLSIAKMHVGNFTQGQTGATYTLTVSNSAAGATDGTMVSVVDTLPAGLTATNIAGTGWVCTLATLTCTRSDVLAVSSSYPAITVTVDVAANATSPQLNMATVSGGGDVTAANNTAMDSTIIDPAAAVADLSIAKMHIGNFTQGQTGATYTITVSNSAAAPTDGTMVSVVDMLPAGLTATNIAGAGWTCTLATLTCSRSDVLAVSNSWPAITLTVDVAGNATTPQVNSVTVSGGGDATPLNNTANDSTTIDGAPAAPDLSLVKSHVGDFTQGQTGATYTLTVNNSAAAATDGTMVSVVDTLPAGLTATNIAGTGWTCTLATLTCTRSDVLPLSTSYPPITLTVDVAANAATPLINNATVTGGGDASPGNNMAADSTTITPTAVPADLSLMKSHVGNFTQGQTGATYTLTVSNSAAGATDGSMVSVVDTLPAGLTATNIAGTGWTCTLATLTCTRSDVLAVSSSYPPITVTVDVLANAATPQVNLATLSGGGDVSIANNTAMDSTIIDGAPPAPDLSINKSHVGNFTQGQVGATYSLLVSNSNVAATDGSLVTVTDLLPAGLTATSMSGAGWTCVLATLTCTRSDVLAAGASYPVITLTATVAASAGSPLVNSAVLTGGGDASPANDTDADAAVVLGGGVVPQSAITIPASSPWSLLAMILAMFALAGLALAGTRRQ